MIQIKQPTSRKKKRNKSEEVERRREGRWIKRVQRTDVVDSTTQTGRF